MQADTNVIAVVSFYGEAYSHVIKLGELEPEWNAISDPLVLICDWQNQKEYTFSEYAALLNERH